MVSAYAHNDLLLGIIALVTGKSADLDAAEQAFQSCPGDFAARFTAAVRAALASQVRPEVFIPIPEQREELSKKELEALVRPATACLKSYPSKSELLEELDRTDRRQQQQRPAWIPRTTSDGQPFDANSPNTDESEREVVVQAFPELEQISVHLPPAWDERPELPLADGGIGQLELALYSLLGIGSSGDDWQGDQILNAAANEALFPNNVRWWAHGDDSRPLSPGEDAGVASELLATVPTLGGVPIRETDGSIEAVARALAGAGSWRHSPQWILRSWDPGSDAALFTAARAPRQHEPHANSPGVHQDLPLVSGYANAPANAGPPWPQSTCATAAGSPTSPANCPTAPLCLCADHATEATPTDGALPSTWPAKTATKTRSCPTDPRSAPPKTPSTAPAASTSTTPPPGNRINPRQTSAQDHLGDHTETVGQFS